MSRITDKWEIVLTIILALLGFAATWGSLGTRVSALEKSNDDTSGFKNGMTKEIAVIHTELHLMMDHFNIPHGGTND